MLFMACLGFRVGVFAVEQKTRSRSFHFENETQSDVQSSAISSFKRATI